MSKEVLCHKCIYRGKAGSNTRHSNCNHPSVDLLLSDHDGLRILFDGLANKYRIPTGLWGLDVVVKESAIVEGWGYWPFNFDPIWIESCNGCRTE